MYYRYICNAITFIMLVLIYLKFTPYYIVNEIKDSEYKCLSS